MIDPLGVSSSLQLRRKFHGIGRRRFAKLIAGTVRIRTLAYAGLVMATQIAVVGGSEATDSVIATAVALGAALGSAGAIVVCGGLGGVMEAACRGAKSVGGVTVGILPGRDPSAANSWVDVVITTGLGEARNALVVGSAAVVIAVDGEYGTLSEIALALRARIPVIGLGTWSLTRPDGGADPGIVPLEDPSAAAIMAMRLASPSASWPNGKGE
jgi:uncharacterized protein (TIGR00725 family)